MLDTCAKPPAWGERIEETGLTVRPDVLKVPSDSELAVAERDFQRATEAAKQMNFRQEATAKALVEARSRYERLLRKALEALQEPV